MVRRGVSREAVEEACDALAASGLVPSVRTVREKLGHTGSLTTIAGHLRTIELKRAEGPGLALPDALVRRLVEGASELWRDLAEAADALADGVRESADAEIAAAHAERDAALDRAARAGEALGASRATIHSLERHLGETSARTERLEGLLETSQAATRAAETDGVTRRDERDALDRELVALRARTEVERLAADKRQVEQARDIDRARTELETARTAHAAERHATTMCSEERDAALAEVKAALAHVEEHAARLEARAAERTSDRDAARAALSTLRVRTDELAAEHDALTAERAALARDNRVTELLERVVNDEHSARVLALLESIDERLGTDAEAADQP